MHGRAGHNAGWCGEASAFFVRWGEKAVLTLPAAARPLWGAEGSLGQRPNVPEAGDEEQTKR